VIDRAVAREAELEVRRETTRGEAVSGLVEVGQDVVEILAHEVRQQEAVVDLRPPADQGPAIRRLPEFRDEAAQQQVLRQAHSARAAASRRPASREAERPVAELRRVHLVDAELGAVRCCRFASISRFRKNAVDEPRRRLRVLRHLAEGDVELIDLVVAGLVDARRLARRADETVR